MATELPNFPLVEIPDPTSTDLADVANTYPLLEDLVVADSAGPEAANRQPRALDARTETMRTLLNQLVEDVNVLNDNFLHRDGIDAISGGSPASSFMRGPLSMTDPIAATAYQVKNTADGSADTDGVTKQQLDALETFLLNLNGSLTDYLRRDGTLAMTGNLNLGNNQAINVADPINQNDAATKQYVDADFATLNTGYLKRDGSLAMLGNLNLGGNKVTNLDLGTPTSDGDLVSRAYLLAVVSSIAATPPGTIVWYAGDASVATPTGWLIADGRTVLESTYAALFTLLGTTYNTGGEPGGSFRLPDLRGRVAIGMDNMGAGSAGVVTDAQADILGGTMGAENHVLTIAQMPTHTHTYDDAYISGDVSGSTIGPDTTDANNDFNETAGRTSGSSGSGNAHNNLQPCMALFVLIKFVILVSLFTPFSYAM